MRRLFADKRIFMNAALLAMFFAFALFSCPWDALSEERQINSGPHSITIRGGGVDDSAAVGLDAREDLLNPFLNLHLFGTFDMLDAGKGIGKVANQKGGAGFALSHTYPKRANVFAGTAVFNEGGEFFEHAYVGGKIKAADYALISGSYGFHIGTQMKIPGQYDVAESVDWGKLGIVLVAQNGFKTNFYYYMADPGSRNISGIEGEVSYPVTSATTVGLTGSSDISEKSNVDRNWRSFLYVAYAFGEGAKGSPIDIALDKNNPVAYPKVIRFTSAVAPAATTATSALSISPTATTNSGCSAPASVFTASGGTGPYTWSSSAPLALSVLNATQAQWYDGGDNYCSGATRTVTVQDSVGATATATITPLL
ncbi:hypothetical protein EPN18_08725 [bacterium]|nr:MAG: hypothetical protein EPN18_08725 [bacterium]